MLQFNKFYLLYFSFFIGKYWKSFKCIEKPERKMFWWLSKSLGSPKYSKNTINPFPFISIFLCYYGFISGWLWCFFFTVSNFASDQPNVSTEKQNKLKYTQFCIQNQVYIESLEKKCCLNCSWTLLTWFCINYCINH